MLDTLQIMLYNNRGIKVMVLFDYLKLFSVYKGLLTEKQAEVFSLYAECDLSLGEIAEIKGVSRQSVSDTISKTKEILLSYENKLSLCKIKSEVYEIATSVDNEDLKSKLLNLLGE